MKNLLINKNRAVCTQKSRYNHAVTDTPLNILVSPDKSA